MINWSNLDTLEAFKELKETPLVDLNKVMSGEAILDKSQIGSGAITMEQITPE